MFVSKINPVAYKNLKIQNKKIQNNNKINSVQNDACSFSSSKNIKKDNKFSYIDNIEIKGKKFDERPTISDIKRNCSDKNIKTKLENNGMEIIILDDNDNPIKGFGRYYKNDAISRIISYRQGFVASEEWLDDNGRTSSFIEYNTDTGYTKRIKSFHENGKTASLIEFDEKTGKRRSEVYYKSDGKSIQRRRVIDIETGEEIKSLTIQEKTENTYKEKKKNIFQRILSKFRK